MHLSAELQTDTDMHIKTKNSKHHPLWVFVLSETHYCQEIEADTGVGAQESYYTVMLKYT